MFAWRLSLSFNINLSYRGSKRWWTPTLGWRYQYRVGWRLRAREPLCRSTCPLRLTYFLKFWKSFRELWYVSWIFHNIIFNSAKFYQTVCRGDALANVKCLRSAKNRLLRNEGNCRWRSIYERSSFAQTLKKANTMQQACRSLNLSRSRMTCFDTVFWYPIRGIASSTDSIICVMYSNNAAKLLVFGTVSDITSLKLHVKQLTS